MHHLARSLVEAWQTGVPLKSFATPATPTDAEAIQDGFADALGGVGAWKVSPLVAEADMVAAPIPAQWVYQSGDVVPLRPGLSVEVELALVVRRDLAPGEALGTDAVDLALAFELISRRLDTAQTWPPLASRADLLSTGGLVLGPRQAFPAAGDCPITLRLGDGTETSVVTQIDPDSLLGALHWLAGHTARRGAPLKAGAAITTGARIGPVPLTAGLATAEAEGLFPVSVRFA